MCAPARLPRMQREVAHATALGDLAHKGVQCVGEARLVGVARLLRRLRHADAALDADGHAGRALGQRGTALGNERGRAHQRGAKAACAGNAIGRAAAVEVDRVVAIWLCYRRRTPQHRRVGSTNLQHELRAVVVHVEKALRVVGVDYRVGRHHLSVERCSCSDAAQQEPKEPICLVHHRCDGKPTVDLSTTAPTVDLGSTAELA